MEESREMLPESERRFGRKLNHEGQKRLAARISRREAYNFVHYHEDLILGATDKQLETAVKKIAKVLRNLRVAKIDAEHARLESLHGIQK